MGHESPLMGESNLSYHRIPTISIKITITFENRERDPKQIALPDDRCGRRDLNPHTHGVSDFKSEASADSATAARKGIISYLLEKHKPKIEQNKY